MSSFKSAAIKILSDAKKPLHYEEITKIALEKGLIETSGATPEATMNAQISIDIKIKKDKSAFVRNKPGYFSLNPNYKETEMQEKEEIEEKIEEEKEEISSQYTGKAGEHLVLSELLFRGFNASIMSVDEGMDIVATKENGLYNIQVKTSNENKYGIYVSDLRIISYQKHNKNNSFYIFVLRSKNQKTNFLILPFSELQRNIDQENILVVNKGTRYRIDIKIREGKLYLGNKENDISYYMNNWKLIK